MVSDMGDQHAPAADAVLESHTHQDGQRTEPEGEERRDRRSRDRYGRDRRERGDRAPREEAGAASNEVPLSQAEGPVAEERTPRYPTGFVADEAAAGSQALSQAVPQSVSQPVSQLVPQPVAQPAPQAVPQPAAQASQSTVPQPAIATKTAPDAAPQAAAMAVPSRSLPKVQSFELPVAELAQVAEGSGLQWVNSDAGKIAAVQAAIAAEPRPARVPRERPPIIVADEGPLVLVETKRDLRDMKLPFEQGTLPLQ
jgi:ribonuclease E